MTTRYTIRDERGVVATLSCPDRAERLSRAGLTVSAVTGAF